MLYLTCTLCGLNTRPQDWTRHILKEAHQVKVREECKNRWWKDKQLRECCLLVFTSVTVTAPFALEIVSEFSRNEDVFVKDFVFWRDRPTLGLVRFLNRTVAGQIWRTYQSGREVDGNRVQLRQVSDCLELEWNTLIPPNVSVEAAEPERDPTPKKRKRCRFEEDQGPEHRRPFPRRTSSTAVNPVPPPIKVEVEDVKQ